MIRRRLLIGAITVAALGGAAWADVVIDWNNVALESVRATNTNPPRATRVFAMVHTAMYDAVNGVFQVYQPYHVTSPAPMGASPDVAAAYAAHTVLAELYPERLGVFDTALNESLSGIPDGPAKDKARAYGRHCGKTILKLRREDGSDDSVPYTPTGQIGHWEPTPPGFAPALLPQWPDVTPWAMTSGDQFRVDPPPALDSIEYAAAFNEVKALGAVDSVTRTADQSEIALFWADGPGTVTPPGHWLQIGQTFAGMFGNTLLQNARLFALLAIAQADGAIVSWDNKYVHDHWRPITGIRQANIDGNQDTEADPSWSSFIVTPPFPAYTSGHSTFSGASSKILERFYGMDAIPFSGTSPGFPGVVRSWDSLSEAAEEAGQSRIHGGIHWQYDNQAGLSSGRALGEYVFANFLSPIGD